MRTTTAAQKLRYLRDLTYENPQVEPIYISGDSQRADGMTKILSGKALIDSQESLNLVAPIFLPDSVQEGRMSAVQNVRHLHALSETDEDEVTARICAFRADRQDESSSLDSTHEQNRIPLRYSIQPDRSHPTRTIRIRDHPRRMVHHRAGAGRGGPGESGSADR